MSDDSRILGIVQDTNNHILSLVQKTTCLSGRIDLCSKSIEDLKEKSDVLAVENKKIIDILQKKMDPDRCTYMHDDIRKQFFFQLERENKSLMEKIKKNVYDDMKKEAKGWLRISVIALKVIAWISVTLGGAAWGAQALGLLKSIGG